MAGAVMLIPTITFAQNTLRSGYFLEGYEYRHVLNPAFGPDRKGFVSFPFLGNLNIGTSANIGVSDFIYETPDGGLTTFLNSSVSNSEFLGNINNNNRMAVDLNWGLFSMGFSKWGGYNTLGINLRANVAMTMPYELFEFMKVGGKGPNTVYDMSDIGFSSQTYAELALGHSRDINDQWRVGGKLKFLFGVYNVSAMIDQMEIQLTDEKWSIKGSGDMNVAFKGLGIPTNEETKKPGDYEPDEAHNFNYSEASLESVGLGGFGMALDLGATYQVYEDLQLSASLLDLGFVSWNDNTRGVMNMKEWEFDGFHDIPYDAPSDDPNSIDSQVDNIKKQLEDFFSFQKEGDKSSRTTALGATLNIGALYTLPYYRGLQFGFLSSTKIHGKYSWSEGRFSLNLAPVKWFDATVNYAISSFGSSMGWVINFHPNKFNFFIGSDHQFFEITPQFVPVGNANMNISMGINFNI